MTITLDLYSAIQQNVLDGLAAVDHGRATESLRQLTADFSISYGDLTISRPDYDRLMADRERVPYNSRHLLSNLVISTRDDDAYDVLFTLTVHRFHPETGDYSMSIADFQDVWDRDGDDVLHLRQRRISTFYETPNASTGRPAEVAKDN